MDARLMLEGGPKGQDPDLPPLVKLGDIVAPAAPTEPAHVQPEFQILLELTVKLAATVARFDTGWVAKSLHFSLPLTRRILEQLSSEGLLEELWATDEGSSHYRISQQGRDFAARLVDQTGYVGPAPVTLESYAAFLRWQFENTPPVKPEHVVKCLSNMVLPKKAQQLAGLAVSSGRSLFVYGPSGNGKSSVGRNIQTALPGDYWIPYCISVSGSVIRVFDDQCHQKVDYKVEKPELIDHRWVRIRRPLVIVGGELTLEMLDLIYSPAYKFYEAPPHLKANGGVFLVDDFGRERISPEQLLNRFITPMEHMIDYFSLRTGQKIVLPLRHVLIIATNLSPELVTDPAFLRRMGYRLYLGPPTRDQYRQIFKAYAEKKGAKYDPAVIEGLFKKYDAEQKELRACEPRDLIERSNDICNFHSRPLELTEKVLDLAWIGYFGEKRILTRVPEINEALPTGVTQSQVPEEGS